MRIVVAIAFSMLFALSGVAQLSSQEHALLAENTIINHKFDPRKPTFLKVGNNAFTRYNPVSLTLGGLLYLYQKAISPQLLSDCPYEISCSAFSKACIQEFGIIKGVALTADRLSRCTQFTLIDIDPSQFNQRSNKFVDDVDKYRIRPHRHHR